MSPEQLTEQFTVPRMARIGGGCGVEYVDRSTVSHLSISSLVQLVRVMVSPVNSPGATSSCQKSMYQCGLLQQLCTILMATGVPADILTEVT